MPAWNPWPDFAVPPEYATRSAADLLLAITGLAQAVPQGDPGHASAEAARQKAVQLLTHAETEPAPLLRKWGLVAAACRLAETSDWDDCCTELDSVT